MRVELTEHPKGKQRFEILLGETIYIISLEEGKKLADLIYVLHPDVKAENEALRDGISEAIATMKEPATRGAKTTLQMCKFLDVWILGLEDALLTGGG